MVSLYWIADALLGILPTLWMTFGLGLPWAFAIVPSKHWHSRAMIVAVSLAVGPAWMTAWMLVLGVIGAQLNQRLFTPEWILSGSVIIALIGVWLAWRKRKHYVPKTSQPSPLALDEKLIISMIVLAVIIRWIHTAFWTFTAYDVLWVYGFQSRLYFLEGFIPNTIDYYPQFVQLQYTYVQVMIGAINDHAARMVIPMMHIGSILATYLLGERLFNRRVGLFTAALWSLHPYVGQWSFIGDLEIPLTFSFTMASTFFLTAWMEVDDSQARRHYAILAGLMLGIAMYTKPTAGAFIWGVMLVVVVELVRLRFRIKLWRPRFMVAFWTGMASIPLGAVWYIRNIALGHDAITFPPDLWLTLARRSGDYLNWIVLAVIIGFIGYGVLQKIPARRFMIGLVGVGMLLIGVLPSNPILFPARFDPPNSYITLTEALWIIIGLSVIGFSLLSTIRHNLIDRPSRTVGIIGWAFVLALPYFATWFYSYSYHYRLGFAIVPLLILPTALLLSKWLTVERIQQWKSGLRISYAMTLVLLSLPGIVSVAVDVTGSSIWLLDKRLDSDIRKYQAFNPALTEIFYGITEYMAEAETAPIIVAPGEQRLPFFFPQMQIINQPITTLEEFEALDATHFIYGTQAGWAYARAGIDPTQNQLVTSLGRLDRFKETKYNSDATFSYEFYYYYNERSRMKKPKIKNYPVLYNDIDIIFGDKLRFRAEGISPNRFFKDQNILLTSVWEALQPILTDYLFVYELYNRDINRVGYQWVLPIAPFRHGYYPTTLWDVGEKVGDQQFVRISPKSKIPDGENYDIRIRVLDPIKNQYLPVTIDGDFIGDFFTLPGKFTVGK
jgi:4-amino-4-deoxy-L-arabinose transferase-like glycosyltransferase